jgi:DNA-binding transcriptional regulator/RsmH inhibitor MraZ
MLGETILSHVGIAKDVCLVGMGATFEIWNPETRAKWLGESSEQDEVALLEELGL